MREILFRGKRIDNGEWVEGYYCGCPDCTKAIGIFDECGGNITAVDGSYGNVKIQKNTVGQFIKEVNKHRIFESDIVKAYKHGDLETQPFIYPIEYRNGTYWFGNWTWLEFLNVMRFVEVIGNIHDKEVTHDS